MCFCTLTSRRPPAPRSFRQTVSRSVVNREISTRTSVFRGAADRPRRDPDRQTVFGLELVAIDFCKHAGLLHVRFRCRQTRYRYYCTLAFWRFRTPRTVFQTQSSAVPVQLKVIVAFVQHGRTVIRDVRHQVELSVVDTLGSAAIDVYNQMKTIE